jgi:hypothetical protein
MRSESLLYESFYERGREREGERGREREGEREGGRGRGGEGEGGREIAEVLDLDCNPVIV